jgi:hypothetical protein
MNELENAEVFKATRQMGGTDSTSPRTSHPPTKKGRDSANPDPRPWPRAYLAFIYIGNRYVFQVSICLNYK